MEPRLLKWIQPVMLAVVLAAGAALLVWRQNRPPDPPPAFLPMAPMEQRPPYPLISPPPASDAAVSTEDRLPSDRPGETGAAAPPAVPSSTSADHMDDWQQHLPTPPGDSPPAASFPVAGPSAVSGGSGAAGEPSTP